MANRFNPEFDPSSDLYDVEAGRADLINPYYTQRLDAQSNAAASLIGGAVASVVDFGATTINSLTFGAADLSTASLLSRISDNALQVYQENRDTIETASFIGGILAPSALALKGIQALKSGTKGLNILSQERRTADLAQLNNLARQGPAASKALDDLQSAIYLRGAASQTLDAAAMEVGVLMAANQHPYMEDYLEDPIKNFGISVALGGVIGAGLGHIGDRFAVKNVIGQAHLDAFEAIKGGLQKGDSALQDVGEGFMAVDKLQVQQANIDHLNAILKGANKSEDGLTREYASRWLEILRSEQETTFQNFMGNMVKDIPDDLATTLRDRFYNDIRFQHIDVVKQAKIAENNKLVAPAPVTKQNVFGKLFETKGKNKVEAAITRVYVPEADSFVSAGDLKHIGRANSLKGVTAESVKKHSGVAQNKIMAADQDAGMLLNSLSAPEVDKMYAEAFTYVDSVPQSLLSKAAVGADDLPMLQATLLRMRKDIAAGKLTDADTITVTTKQPIYSEEIVTKTLGRAGVKPTYQQELEQLAGKHGAAINDPRRRGLSSAAKSLLTGWTSGRRVNEMRSVADAFFYRGYSLTSLHDDLQPSLKAFEEIYNHPSSVAFRAKMAALADPEGYVYLWRGMKEDVKGHAVLASYTANYQQANQGFAKGKGAKLYRIHKDDIVANIVDDVGDGYGKTNTGGEILVRAPAHPTEPVIPVGTTQQPLSQTLPSNTSTQKLTAQQLTDYVLDLKQRMITDLAKTGTDELGIAIRTNTTVDAVRDFLLNKKPLGTSNASAFEYHSLTALDEKLGMGNQPLAMSSNVRKKSWAVVQAQMDKQTMDKINNQIIGSFLRQSQAPIARALHSMFFTKESARILNIVRGQLGYANNGYAGTRFVESADSAYRLMKELGTFATYTGQRIEELGNATMKRFLEPLKGTMEKVAVDVVKRTELDIARQLNASLAGWRSYHDRQFWQKAMQMAEDGKQVEVEVPVMFRGKAFMVQSDEVDELLTAFGKIGREMYATKNLGHKIIGRPNMNDIGYWLPSNNPRNKFIGYIHDVEANATQLVIANTADDLQEMLVHLNKRYSNEVAKGTMLIFDKQSQKHLNLVRGRDDALFMRVANEDMLHSGSSASLFMKSNADPLAEIIGGIEHSVIGNVTQLAETALWDISSTLKRMSEVNQAKVANQPLSKYVKALNKQKDAAAEVRNTMFNLRSLPDYTTWNDINSGFESAVGWTMQKLSESWKAIKPASGKELSYDEYKKALTKAGVMDTFADFGAQAGEFYRHSYGTDVGNQAARLVTLANGYAATSALRFGDLAQPLVNAMSLPILMMGNALDKFPTSFMGVAKKAEIKGMLGATQVMHDGVRAMNSQAHAGLDKLWRGRSYFQPIVSEASDVLSLPRDLTPGLMTSLEKGLKHKIVEDWLAKPADYAEQLTRRTAMHTGAVLARRMYPGLSDEATTIFAKSFMDRVIGNYHAAQRPVFFQGTLGVAMGLFQTYFLTMTQAMYRQLQLGNKKALGAMMLMQGGVFGAASLPGFNQISAMIGEHYSDEHVDLRTGTIRAVSDPVAKAILYGLPSNMGPALYTRGELAPRISTPANLEALPQVQMFGQVAGTMGQMISALGAPSEDVPRNLLQALSMQSVNRPIARLSEIASGYSVTSQGNTVSTPDEVWTVTGVMARLLGARTTEEALAREALHLDRFYESGDRENRQKVVNALRTAIRAGTDDGDKIDKLALDYIDEGGTPAGWRSAVRTAIMTTEQPLNETLKDKLKEDSAINIMIDTLDD